MRKHFFAVAAFSAIAASAAAGQSAPVATPFDCGGTHNPNISAEWLYLSKDSGMHESYIVNVTFIGLKPGNAEAMQTLKQCLAAFMKKDMSQDILMAPWYRKQRNADPSLDILLEPFPEHRALTYNKTKRKVVMIQSGLDHATVKTD